MLAHDLMNLAAAIDMTAEAIAPNRAFLRRAAEELRRHAGEATALEAGIIPGLMRLDPAALPDGVVAIGSGPSSAGRGASAPPGALNAPVAGEAGSAARDVPPGAPWAFPHRTMAEVIAAESPDDGDAA